MANFPDLNYPQWLRDMLQPRKGATVAGSGLLGAHQIGSNAWGRFEFNRKFGSLAQFGIGVTKSSNGEITVKLR